MKSGSVGGIFHYTVVRQLLGIAGLFVLGCGGVSPPPDDPTITPTPTPVPKISLAGTWERDDHQEAMTIGDNGTVLTDSLVLEPGSTYRNVIPCDGQKHRLSSPVAASPVNQLQVLIAPFTVTADADGNVTMSQHLYQEIWVGDTFPCREMEISATGTLTSPTQMVLEVLKNPMGLRQTFTFTRTGN